MRERSRVPLWLYPKSHESEAVDTLDREKSGLEPAAIDRIPQHSTNAEIAYRIVNHTIAQERWSVELSTASAHCVNILANLWHSPQMDRVKVGIPTIDPSDGAMLGGVAAWRLWRKRRKQVGMPFDSPNFVVSQGCSSAWDRFSKKWHIEMRSVPVSLDSPIMDVDRAKDLCDENTIMVVATMGLPSTGLNDDVEALNNSLERLFRTTSLDIPIHVDAESGGFLEPFLRANTKWDFRLSRVVSISTSADKYGLVNPSLGWIVWRGMAQMPFEMTMDRGSYSYEGLRSLSPPTYIAAQYYTYIRLGFDGYRAIHHHSMEVAQYVASRLAEIPQIRLIIRELQGPIVVFSLTTADSNSAQLSLADLQKTLSKHGWRASTLRLPQGMGNEPAISISLHSKVDMDMADMLLCHVRGWLERAFNYQFASEKELASE